MTTRQFPDKSPDEAKLCAFDFTNEKATGSTLSTPIVEKSLVEGSDTGAAGLTLGTPALDPDGVTVKVLVSGGVEGSKYRLVATVDANNDEVHQIAATLLVAESAA